MKWMRFRIRTNEESEDIIVSSMMDIGLEGAQIEDNAPLTAADKEQMFTDDLQDADDEETGVDSCAVIAPGEEGVAYLNFFLEVDDDNMLTVHEYDDNGEEVEIKKTPDQIKQEIRGVLDELSSFSDIGDGTISVDVTEDIDWINNWKQYFHKFLVDDVLVIPSWETPDEEDKKKANITLHIDPGTAFGTGMHETTQLCIRALRKYMTPEAEVLDIGTGSGVLSILAMKFGAGHCVGTDLDPCSEPAVDDNKKNNDIADKDFDLIIGNIIDDEKVQEEVGKEKYDIVVANILPYVLVPLTPIVPGLLKTGGIYITSGIIEAKEDVIRKAHEDAGLDIIEVCKQGEWVSVISKKN
ncbi:ribosomal protein L11 methyltransferase [Butyrivibrio sp. ob235]|uniref:50S ribosomal protein L11 methyltransferase n=1 Tax=Butyrivibrio sp. ob235 TaxID=1761780 RepID=UPI0008B2A7D1|nr:50S ribosomal protein L11 methyltransferase [Butyrivibrio sp. ob235]SEK79524.1 ribosomal protein L11 methyltransferase [Butyrivibrio sp. ob235]